MEIALLFFLILVNGAFAMSEIALVASRKGRLQKLADEGDHGAARALELNQEPTRFLSTVQIGITSIAILNGIVGEAAFAEPVANWLEEDIHALLVEGSESGAIEDTEHEMVRNVFRLDDRQLGSLMVPRAHIVLLDANLSWKENAKRIEESDHSRYPVVRRDLHDILGIVTARHLLVDTLKGRTPDLTKNLQTPVFVPESLTGMGLLDNFRASGTHLGFVVDEYGEVLGMVTLTDLLEAITGEFKPRSAEDAWAVQRGDGSWLLDGLIPIPELKDRLALKTVPEEGTEKYHTLSGMMMLLLGRMANTADKVDWEDWCLEIVDMDGRRIDKVLASAKPGPQAGATMPVK